MAEAILASEQVEKLPQVELPAVLASVLAEFARLPKDLLVCNGPGNAGDSEPKKEEKSELMRKRLAEKARLHVRHS
jgi:hypothetical protein